MELETLAVLEMTVPTGRLALTLKTYVKSAELFAASVLIVQELDGQGPDGPVAETKVVPDGGGSATVTSGASSGPRLKTVTVYVRLLPAPIADGPDLIIARSALGTVSCTTNVAVTTPSVSLFRVFTDQVPGCLNGSPTAKLSKNVTDCGSDVIAVCWATSPFGATNARRRWFGKGAPVTLAQTVSPQVKSVGAGGVVQSDLKMLMLSANAATEPPPANIEAPRVKPTSSTPRAMPTGSAFERNSLLEIGILVAGRLADEKIDPLTLLKIWTLVP
ncbi:MAG: hypothetical protein AABN33_11160 [Acidobacteriota bacterium]